MTTNLTNNFPIGFNATLEREMNLNNSQTSQKYSQLSQGVVFIYSNIEIKK